MLLLAFGSIFLLAIILLFYHFRQKGSDDIPDGRPISHFFILWSYNITIVCNILKIIEMCITMFQIRCMYLWFLLKTTKISLQVSVRCT